MSETSNPGLEGVVAVETEIAEPDKEGGAGLRYRGVDIEDARRPVPYEKVWGLLVDESFEPGMPDPEPYEPDGLSGQRPSDLQAETARLSSEWGLGKLVDIDESQARDDLARLSAQMMSIVAKSAAVADGREPRPRRRRRRRATAAEKFLLRWRGEADPDHVKGDRHLLDLHRRARAERLHVHRADHRVDRGGLRRRDVRRPSGALSGPLHGGAPARVLPMLDEVARTGDPEALCQEDPRQPRERIMGFGHRVYRAEDPRSRIFKRTAQELGSPAFEVAEALEEGCTRRAAPTKARLRNRHERRVLLGRRPRPGRGSTRPDAGDVRLLPGRRLVGSHPRGEAHRKVDPALGAVRRTRAALGRFGRLTVCGSSQRPSSAPRALVTSAHSQTSAETSTTRSTRRSTAGLPRARDRLSRDRPAPLRAEDRDAPSRPRR